MTLRREGKGKTLSLFAVTREAGPSWIDGQGSFEQPAVKDHAAFMDSLADEGVVLFAGPLAASGHDHIRALLIAKASDEAVVRGRLAGDPWELTHRVVTTSVEPWNLLVGAERLGTPQPMTRQIGRRFLDTDCKGPSHQRRGRAGQPPTASWGGSCTRIYSPRRASQHPVLNGPERRNSACFSALPLRLPRQRPTQGTVGNNPRDGQPLATR